MIFIQVQNKKLLYNPAAVWNKSIIESDLYDQILLDFIFIFF